MFSKNGRKNAVLKKKFLLSISAFVLSVTTTFQQVILFPHILEHGVLLLHTKLLPSLEDGGGEREKQKGPTDGCGGGGA